MQQEKMEQEIIQQPIEQAAENTVQANGEKALPKETVGFWEFLGLIVLFSIPIIGFIACIVFMFSPKRKNIKNYARATFTWIMAQLITTVAIVLIALTIIGNLILPTINDSLNTDFQNVFEVIDLAYSAKTGNYSKVIKTMQPQLVEMFGEQHKPLFAELSNEKYNNMFTQIVNQDYGSLLEDFNSDKYQSLKDAIGEENFNELKNELQSAEKGEPSEIFDSIRSLLSGF